MDNWNIFTVGSGPSSFHSTGEEDGTGEEGFTQNWHLWIFHTL